MENVISRVRNTANLIVLVVVLTAQVLALAIQVKRPNEAGGTRLIRVWAISVLTPITRSFVRTENWFSDNWHNYVWLRGVRKENEDLKDQIVQMKMREVRLLEDANQARRLQKLLNFKQQFISQTVAAQVISTTGSEFSRAVYIDKGTNDGIKDDMPVVSPEGVAGKVLQAFPTTSLVLLINDPSSGAGVILEKSRLQGIVRGDPNAVGTVVIRNVMADEKVEVGDRVLTSGGDQVFPKGMMVGTVSSVQPGNDIFLKIRVRPAAPINRLEEVLVITKVDEHMSDSVALDTPVRAIDVLANRLPTVAPPPKDGTTPAGTKPAPGTSSPSSKPATAETAAPGTANSKPNANVTSPPATRPKTPELPLTTPTAPNAKPLPPKASGSSPAITNGTGATQSPKPRELKSNTVNPAHQTEPKDEPH